MSTESVMPSNRLTLSCPLLLLSVFPSIRVFFKESVLHFRWSKYWSFSFSISPSNEYSGLISFKIHWFDLLVVQRTLKSLPQHHYSKASVFWCSTLFMVQLSHLCMTTGKTIVLTILLCKQSDVSDTRKKNSACNARNLGSIPRLGRSPGEGNGFPL